MTKREKRVRKLFQNPKTVPFKELDRVLKDAGFKMRQPGSGSSHSVYTKGEIQISVPFRRPFVKEVYVKRVLELLGEE
ncbi:MAG: toxin HicA [Candidatus Daviesbacteria bacterium]|nr:toxin HicA [Candidatus Daviesbacteria bacterium]